jgi:hypothetical protein
MALRLNGSSSGYVELDVPAAAGSHTLTLPDGGGSSGQYLQTDGSGGLSWAGVTTGKILQVVQSSDTGKPSSTSSTYADTGLSGTITPSSSSNKVLVIVYEGQCYKTANDTQLDFQLLRDSTSIFTYTALNIGSVVDSTNPTIPYLDSPATTSEVTYKTQFRNRDSSGTVVVNGNGTQIMLLMEVAA